MNARILVVDDDRDTVKSLSLLLGMDGHSAIAVVDPRQVISVAEEFRPQLIVLDLAMPGLSGEEVTRQIRQHPGLKDTTIAVVTGYCRDSDRSSALAAGADFFFRKPIGIEQLRDVLQRVPPRGIASRILTPVKIADAVCQDS